MIKYAFRAGFPKIWAFWGHNINLGCHEVINYTRYIGVDDGKQNVKKKVVDVFNDSFFKKFC